MISPVHNNNANGRGGFTILELVLVLLLIVIVSGLAVPSFQAWLQSQRLREGVDTVRTQWVTARTRAVEEGRPYRFAWMPQSGNYRFAPHDVDHWPDMLDTSSSIPFSGGGYAPGIVVERTLPEGVNFTHWEYSPGSGQTGPNGWTSDTVLLWPDGTTRIYTAEGLELQESAIVLMDQRGRSTSLHIRGVTGGLRIFYPDDGS